MLTGVRCNDLRYLIHWSMWIDYISFRARLTIRSMRLSISSRRDTLYEEWVASRGEMCLPYHRFKGEAWGGEKVREGKGNKEREKEEGGVQVYSFYRYISIYFRSIRIGSAHAFDIVQGPSEIMYEAKKSVECCGLAPRGGSTVMNTLSIVPCSLRWSRCKRQFTSRWLLHKEVRIRHVTD